MRLCKRFGFNFEGTEEDWPVLSVEFSSLKDRKINEVYEVMYSPTTPGFMTDLFDCLLVYPPSSKFRSHLQFPHAHII